MYNAQHFRQKLAQGRVCIGTCVASTDWTLTEALATACDFIFLDGEHGPLSLEVIQRHAVAVAASQTALLVRVAWNDPVLAKPVLDLGADGIIFPMIRSVDEAKLAVAACRYPPHGVRGFGPRRASRYGSYPGNDFIDAANRWVIPIPQIEHIDAVNAVEAIAAVDGADVFLIGPNDLAASIGHIGKPEHPENLRLIERVIHAIHAAGKHVGIATGNDDPAFTQTLIDRGADWISQGGEASLMLRSLRAIRAVADKPAGR